MNELQKVIGKKYISGIFNFIIKYSKYNTTPESIGGDGSFLPKLKSLWISEDNYCWFQPMKGEIE